MPFLFGFPDFMTSKNAMRRPTAYQANCRDCPRPATFLDDVKNEYPSYFCKPVPPFGVAKSVPRMVGLAPGMYGANRTGRPFTADDAGTLSYSTLHKLVLLIVPTLLRQAMA